MALTIDRRFTSPNHEVATMFSWTYRDCGINEKKRVLCPENWSQNACDMLADKYLRRAGVPDECVKIKEEGVPSRLQRGTPEEGATFCREDSAAAVFTRLAGAWAYHGLKAGYFDAANALAFFDEIWYMLANQMAAPNSPQFFNTGLWWAYGIEGPDAGNWAFNTSLAGEAVAYQVGDYYSHPQASACFLQSIKDDLVNEGGIMDLWVREAKAFKGGGGSGTNFSSLRSKGEPLSGGGSASGLESWLKIGDVAAGSIKSAGTTRRAAKLVTVDLDHPEIEWFINWKVTEERKVACLVAGDELIRSRSDDPLVGEAIRKKYAGPTDAPKLDLSFTGEAYASVSGQNSNNSVRITHAQMEALLSSDGQIELKRRTDGVVTKVLKGATLWETLCAAAWSCADPGVQFDTTINEWHTCASDERITTANPCAEYNWIADTACNLASLNIVKFQNEHGDLDVSLWEFACRLWTTVLDITVGMASYPTGSIARGSGNYRTLGLGYANLGAAIMRRGNAYDSQEARNWAGGVTAVMHFAAALQSAHMASVLGAFPRYEQNVVDMQRVMTNHEAHLYEDAPTFGLYHEPNRLLSGAQGRELVNVAQSLASDARRVSAKYGYRNAQFTLLAPTGCLVAGSMVLTDKGLRRLGSLGNTQGNQWQPVEFAVQTDEGPKAATRFFVNGEDDVIQVRTKSGYELKGTPKHRIKVLAASGDWEWKRFRDLEKGDRVPLRIGGMFGDTQEVVLPPCGEAYRVNIGRGVKTPRRLSENLAALVGLFMAEGSLHSKGLRFSLTAADQDLIDWCSEACESLFGIAPTVELHDKCVAVCLSSMQVKRWWEDAGFTKRPGKKAGKGWTCHIPEAILASNDPLIYGAFVRGVFSGDGSVSVGLPSVANKDLEFILELQAMLLAIGVVTRKDMHTGGLSGKPVYRLTAKSRRYAMVFGQVAGFLAGRKHDLLATQLGDDRGDRVILRMEVEERVIPLGHQDRGVLERSRRAKTGGVPRTIALELARTSEEYAFAADYFFDEIKEAALVGRDSTFDLSVPENVTYIANGFVSHNTIGLTMDCDTTGVEPDYALVKYKTLVGGGGMHFVNQSVSQALDKLKYHPNDSMQIRKEILDGRERVGIKPEHLSVFHCANEISVKGHIDMMAAVQPFLSGAISKTINMPHGATVEDVKEAYAYGWKKNLKAMALYRDQSKLSQPLTVKPKADKPKADKELIPLPLSYTDFTYTVFKTVPPVHKRETPGRGDRRKLPNPRTGPIYKARLAGHAVYIRAGEFEDGTLGEVFIDIAKEGADIRSWAACFSRSVSIGLQYGVPLSVLANAFRDMAFEPSGIVQELDSIKMARSVVDLVFQVLEKHYATPAPVTIIKKEADPVKVEGLGNPIPGAEWIGPTPEDAKAKGFLGEPCLNCGKFTLIRTGSCTMCKSCNVQSGGCG